MVSLGLGPMLKTILYKIIRVVVGVIKDISNCFEDRESRLLRRNVFSCSFPFLFLLLFEEIYCLPKTVQVLSVELELGFSLFFLIFHADAAVWKTREGMKGSSSLASLGEGCSEKGNRDILEQAKEELQILEAQQPNRFNYLKLELKSFISFLESRSLILSENECVKVLAWAAADSTSVSVSSSATTQASSTCKKRKKVVHENQEIMEGQMQKFQRMDRLDAVFERARACLDKIQQFKQFISGES